MYHNVQIINRTGREIAFDWVELVQSSPLFMQSPSNASVWDMKNTASIAIGGDMLCIHPGSDNAIERVLRTLSEEASYRHRCDAYIEKNCSGQKFTVILKPEMEAERKTVFFGKYFRNSNLMEPIEWIVLEECDGTALLLSKSALHTTGYWLGNIGEAYQENGRNLLWENTPLRKWLNQDFCRMIFTEEERKLLLNHPIVTAPDTNPRLRRNRIFLLSEEEIIGYLPTKKERQTQATPFATFGGAAEIDGNCCWWLLPHKGHIPQAVLGNGEIQYHSRNVAHRDWCLRPVIQVSTATLNAMPTKKTENIIRQKRLPLDDKGMYLRSLSQNGVLLKLSIDKETASDSHYELEPTAVKQLRTILQKVCGNGDLVWLLRRYFQTNSDYSLTSLLKANGIPFKQFHYD